MKRLLLALALCCGASLGAEENPPLPGFDAAGSDPQAVRVADQVMEKLGGRKNWDAARYLSWRFFGGRRHVWDKWSGDLRFEDGERTVLLNLHTREGNSWRAGEPVADVDTLKADLERAYRAWINDAYWMFMPYKLKDSGVTLKYTGEGQDAEGRPAHVLTLTFKDIGVTPQNRYDVWVDTSEYLVRQWAFYPDAGDAEPRFTGPWSNWRTYGSIWLADGRGQRNHSEIAVFAELPRSVFTDPTPVDLEAFPGWR